MNHRIKKYVKLIYVSETSAQYYFFHKFMGDPGDPLEILRRPPRRSRPTG